MLTLLQSSGLSGRRAGFTLVEVLVALAIMLAGLVAVVAAFPNMLQAQRQAELLTLGTALGQLRVEELRRDNDRNNRLILEVQSLTVPTDPIVFPSEPRLAYSFSGTTVLYANQPANDPRAFPGVARLLIRYAPSYRASQDVIDEIRFDR
jgi:prepilin-type N-terminal cleavage/methylation domain-containing protein